MECVCVYVHVQWEGGREGKDICMLWVEYSIIR